MHFVHFLMSMLTNQASHYLINTGTNIFCLWSWCKEECWAQPVQHWKKQRFNFLFPLSTKLIQRPLSEKNNCAEGLAYGGTGCRVCKHPSWWEMLMPGEDPAFQPYPCWEQPPPCLRSFASSLSCTWLGLVSRTKKMSPSPLTGMAAVGSAGRGQLCPWGGNLLLSPTGIGVGSQEGTRTQLCMVSSSGKVLKWCSLL